MKFTKLIINEMSTTNVTSRDINKMNEFQLVDILQKFPFPEQWKDRQAWKDADYRFKQIKQLAQKQRGNQDVFSKRLGQK